VFWASNKTNRGVNVRLPLDTKMAEAASRAVAMHEIPHEDGNYFECAWC
jgi:hypothetical protein